MIIALAILSGLLVSISLAFLFFYTIGKGFIKNLKESHASQLEMERKHARDYKELAIATLNRFLRWSEAATLDEPLDSPEQPEEITPEKLDQMPLAELEKLAATESGHGRPGVMRGIQSSRFALYQALNRARIREERRDAPPGDNIVDNPAVPGEDFTDEDEEHLEKMG